MPFKGMIFDLNGTPADSLGAVEPTWGVRADSQGLDKAAVQHFKHSKPILRMLRYFMPEASSEKISNKFAQHEACETSHTDGITSIPDTVGFHSHLNPLSFPWPIVTSDLLKVAAAWIRQIGQSFSSVLIARKNIQQAKSGQPLQAGHHQVN
ncbi:hypothetical protein CJP72_24455 [Citrobacter sp. NCU1]|uniref:hypothetical protein n=1 Tax=Citrobacter sp. NCU1 TaxID=2026683 RepID=UPI0013918C5D|nr:hypothetical protein [Citrobacter sp. NCU1]NDO83779.1 hypothetical protein [Citrobacter sp. NCU1]